MDWLYENPLPELVICGVIALASLVVAVQKQRPVFLIGTLIFLLLGGGLFMLDRDRQTDREAVEFAVHDIVLKFSQNDLDGTLAYISPRAIVLRGMVTNGIEWVDVEDVRVTDVSVDLSNQNSIALTHFRVNATATIERSGNVGHRPTRWQAEWQKTDQGWLMTEIQPIDVVTGHEVDWPKPLNPKP